MEALRPKHPIKPGVPCGRCDVGIYDFHAACNPLAQAVLDGGPIPRCKLSNRPCVGALDLRGEPAMGEA